MLRGFGAANGALRAGVDVASPGPGVAGVDSDSDSCAAEIEAAALAGDLALAAGPRWQGRRTAPDAGA